MKNPGRLLAVVCALVIGVYAYMARSGGTELVTADAANSDYNLLVQGFRTGHLSLNKIPPPELVRLTDPYDPDANVAFRAAPYGLQDLSYYKGRLYLYFGITPALILFWPFAALTNHYLFQRHAVLIFCSLGFLASISLLRGLWRRYFAEVSAPVLAACALALGFTTGVPLLLSRCDVYEVPISCGSMLTMLSLAALWRALHETEQKAPWLAMASAAYGLAVGARPNLLFGVFILLVPPIQAWRERRRMWTLLLSATGPVALVGSALLLYNARRFDNPLEFGWRHLLSTYDPTKVPHPFSPRFFWYNLRMYFLELARWDIRFPFIHPTKVPPSPAGYFTAEPSLGILTHTPVVWLALAAPLAWQRRLPEACTLRWYVMTVALLFGICAATVGLFFAACTRYQLDFLPALLLLAVIGILALERALAGRPVWRRAARALWGLLLGFSVAFGFLATARNYAQAHNDLGVSSWQTGRVPEAMGHYERALEIDPDYAEACYNLGIALGQAGKPQEEIRYYEQALRLKPDYAEAHNNLGSALGALGRQQEAIEHFEQALQINPDFAEAHNNLANALARLGRTTEAITHWEQALQINPDFVEAHNNLGLALTGMGRLQDATAQFERALQLKPDYADAQYNLADALALARRWPEAIPHYQQALRLNPNLIDGRYNLGIALAQRGRFAEAADQFEQFVRATPNDPRGHNQLGVCLMQLGRIAEAREQFRQALKTKPDYADAQANLARIQTLP